MKRILSAIV